MLILNLNGLCNQRVILSDQSTGEFVWDEPGNESTCRFQAFDHVGFEVPKLEIKNGAVISAIDGSENYKIRLLR